MICSSSTRLGALFVSVLALPACSLFESSGGALNDVDELVARIERLHVETELARNESQEALIRLRELVAPEFTGNVLVAFDTFQAAVDRSESQAEQLRATTTAMREVAEPLFQRWRADLLAFSNPQLRQRSEARLQETQARYTAILAAAEPAQSTLDRLNLGLRDVALFLGNDFNRGSLAAISEDVRATVETHNELDARLGASLQAAIAYLDSAAMPEHAPSSDPASATGPTVQPAGPGR